MMGPKWAGGEMADTLPLGGSAARHGSSSLPPPTILNWGGETCLRTFRGRLEKRSDISSADEIASWVRSEYLKPRKAF